MIVIIFRRLLIALWSGSPIAPKMFDIYISSSICEQAVWRFGHFPIASLRKLSVAIFHVHNLTQGNKQTTIHYFRKLVWGNMYDATCKISSGVFRRYFPGKRQLSWLLAKLSYPNHTHKFKFPLCLEAHRKLCFDSCGFE